MSIPSQEFKKKTAMVFGASQGIGLAITKQLLENKDFDRVVATHRHGSETKSLAPLKKSYPETLHLMEFDATSQRHLDTMAENVEMISETIDLLINCIGILHDTRMKPEKNIDEISADFLIESFRVNSITTLLLAKHLKPFIQNSNDAVFISLSAKVGSIEDNKTGGWYAYRISKAALNMSIKNLSIEFNRLSRRCSVFAVHPGTTETHLSEPFIERARKKYTVHTPAATAANILKMAFDPDHKRYNGKLISWNGEEIPW